MDMMTRNWSAHTFKIEQKERHKVDLNAPNCEHGGHGPRTGGGPKNYANAYDGQPRTGARATPRLSQAE